MRKIARYFVYIPCVLCAVFFFAWNSEAQTRSEFTLSTGYRVDELQWSIAGDINGCCPNILSELTWSDISSYNVKAAYNFYEGQFLYGRASLDYGFIFSGNNQDSDYLEDNHNAEFSRSNNNSDSGYVLDGTAGIGYRIRSVRGGVELIPMIGYSYHKQNLTITDGFQTIPETGAFSGLDSSYRARWQGPWIGTDIHYATKQWALLTKLEYHLADYYAYANWNLRDDFEHPVSYEHWADGSGFVFALDGDYKLNDRWSFVGTLDAQYWKATSGLDRTYFSDGTSSDTRLNQVVWDSYAALVGLKYTF